MSRLLAEEADMEWLPSREEAGDRRSDVRARRTGLGCQSDDRRDASYQFYRATCFSL